MYNSVQVGLIIHERIYLNNTIIKEINFFKLKQNVLTKKIWL